MIVLSAAPALAQTPTPTPTITATPTIPAGHGWGRIYRSAKTFGDVTGAGCPITAVDKNGVRTYVRRCPGQQAETLLIDDWSYPSENPSQLRLRLEFIEQYDNIFSITPTRTVGATTPTPVRNKRNERKRCIAASCGCAAPSSSYLNMTYGTEQRASADSGVWHDSLYIRPVTAVLTCANAAPGRKCRIRVTRDPNDASCFENSPGELDVTGAYISWPGAKIPSCAAEERGYITWGTNDGTTLSAPVARVGQAASSWINDYQTLPWDFFTDANKTYDEIRTSLINAGGEYKAWLDSLDHWRSRINAGQDVDVPFVYYSPETTAQTCAGVPRGCLTPYAPDPNWTPSTNYTQPADPCGCTMSFASTYTQDAWANSVWWHVKHFAQRGNVKHVLILIEINTYDNAHVGYWQSMFAKAKARIKNDVTIQNALVGATFVMPSLNREACNMTAWSSCIRVCAGGVNQGQECTADTDCPHPTPTPGNATCTAGNCQNYHADCASNACNWNCQDCSNRNLSAETFYNALITNAPADERPEFLGASHYYGPYCDTPECLLDGFYSDWTQDSQLPVYIEEGGLWRYAVRHEEDGLRWYQWWLDKVCAASGSYGTVHIAVNGPYDYYIDFWGSQVPWGVSPQRGDGTYRLYGQWFDKLP